MYDFSNTGGVRTILELASRMSKKGHEVSISTLDRGRKITFPLDRNIKIHEANVPTVFKLLDPIFYLRTRGRMKTNLHALQSLSDRMGLNIHFDLDMELYKVIPDCDISAATFSLTAFPVYYGKGKVKVYHMQHFEPLALGNEYDKKRSAESYRLPIIKIANSSWLKKKLITEVGQESVCVPWGINTEIFNTKKRSSERLEGLFKRDNKEVYVVSLGKSTKWKGISDVFAAMKYIKEKTKINIKLILYGHEPQLKELSPVDCEYVIGPSDDELVFLYQNCDVVVTASYYESFPLPPIEGMSCGAKVVTTPYGVEDYAKDGYNSIIVKPKDPKSLANGIIKAVTDDSLGSLIKKNGAITGKKFTWEKSIDKIEKIYKDSLNSL